MTSYLELLKLAAPETILVITALFVLIIDLVALRDLGLRFRSIIGGTISCAGCLAALTWMLLFSQQTNFLQGLIVVDPLTNLVKAALLVLTGLTILISVENSFTGHAGEYFALILMAAIGMMFLVSSQDILMLFISLELTSLSLYILTAFNKRNIKSAEAALKYFLFGGMSAAVTLFGFSLLYGLSGATNLSQIAAACQGLKLDPLLAVAIVMTVAGFGFKVAAAPFHLWAPDVYEGAPTPSAALIASGSKVAGFYVFARVMMLGFAGSEGIAAWQGFLPGWAPVVALAAAASMVLGNLAALVQTSVRRLLAYSAIAHAGYMLLGVMSRGGESLVPLMYYAITYGLTALGAFGVVSVVQEGTGGERLTDFAGLSRRAPGLSFCMLIFILSLAGIPPLAGFFGKFYLFSFALGAGPETSGLLWLVILGVAMSAVSLYYYLRLLNQIYINKDSDTAEPLRVSVLTRVAVALSALGVVALGCAPDLLIERLQRAVRIAGL